MVIHSNKNCKISYRNIFARKWKFRLDSKKKSASSILYMIFFMVIFLGFCSFAVDGSIVLTNRIKLQNATEQTALIAASEFVKNPDNVQIRAEETFKLLKADSLQNAKISVLSNKSTNQVLVTTNMVSQPFFLSFLGVSGITLEAKACAVSESLSVAANYAGVNWLTPKAVYLSDILSKDTNLNDTAILLPLGHFLSASYDSDTSFPLYSLINDDGNNSPLSLGPGGFITMRLPAPIVDKPGDDLFVKEIGDAIDGYMIYAGIDNNPQNPYVRADNVGDKISWINISCAAEAEDSAFSSKVKSTAVTSGFGAQDKVYGSVSIDISNSCIGDISVIKYLRIIDDNEESAFYKGNDGNYYKTMIYGDSSTSTSGADIDYIKVLNSVRLISPNAYSP